MTVNILTEVADFTALCMPSPEREIHGVYIGDLLSWVMGKANADDLWITIMSNINIAAVATLADVSCILLAEGVILENDVLETARAKDINILSTPLSAYEAAIKVSGIIR